MKLSVIKFNQRDPKWAGEKLGTSSVTLGGYGCAVTVLAMVECYYGFDTDPSRLNKLLIEKNCYLDRNLMKWWDIYKVNEFVKTTEWIDCPLTPAPIKKVDDELNSGRPVIAWVDINPMEAGDQQHFVVIIGKTEDSHYIINDPWTGEEYFLDAIYGQPVEAIHGLRIISGPVPQPEPPKPNIDALNQQIDTLKQQQDDIRTALKLPAQSDISDITRRIVELLGKESEYVEHLKQDETNIEKPDHKHEGYVFDGKWDIGNWLIEFWKKVKKDG
jgi:hypothetical protein